MEGDRLNLRAHPPQFANDGNASTAWRSTAGLDAAGLALDMQHVIELQEVVFHFASPLPTNTTVERSSDGVTWTAYQYFAFDCNASFGLVPDTVSARDGPICSSISPTDTTLTFYILRNRFLPGLPYIRDAILQDFARTQYLRLSMFGFPIATAVRYDYFAVSEIEIIGRVDCNGHASVYDPDTLDCQCEHFTAGAACERCLPLYNRKSWQRGIDVDEGNECRPCRCHGNAESCVYNALVDTHTDARYRGDGGVCDCTNHTVGQNCNVCTDGYFGSASRLDSDLGDAMYACAPCDCNTAGTTFGQTCARVGGQCPCKDMVFGRTCDQCPEDMLGPVGRGTDDVVACQVRILNHACYMGECLC